MTGPELLLVKVAAAGRIKADRAYRQAIAEALTAGHSYAVVARAAGVTRQAIRQIHGSGVG